MHSTVCNLLILAVIGYAPEQSSYFVQVHDTHLRRLWHDRDRQSREQSLHMPKWCNMQEFAYLHDRDTLRCQALVSGVDGYDDRTSSDDNMAWGLEALRSRKMISDAELTNVCMLETLYTAVLLFQELTVFQRKE